MRSAGLRRNRPSMRPVAGGGSAVGVVVGAAVDSAAGDVAGSGADADAGGYSGSLWASQCGVCSPCGGVMSARRSRSYHSRGWCN